MSDRAKLLLGVAVTAAYALLLLVSYLFEFSALLFAVTLPWSCLIAVLGMLLIHASSIPLDDYLFTGGLLNLGIMVKAAVFGPLINKRID